MRLAGIFDIADVAFPSRGEGLLMRSDAVPGFPLMLTRGCIYLCVHVFSLLEEPPSGLPRRCGGEGERESALCDDALHARRVEADRAFGECALAGEGKVESSIMNKYMREAFVVKCRRISESSVKCLQ